MPRGHRRVVDSGWWIWEWGMGEKAEKTDRQTDRQVLLRRPVILHSWVCLFTP